MEKTEQELKFEKFEKQEARKEKLAGIFAGEENGKSYKSVYDNPKSGLKELLEKTPEILENDAWLTREMSNAMDNVMKGTATETSAQVAPAAPVNAPTAPAVQQGAPTAPEGNTAPETVNLRTVGRKGGITVDEFCKKSGMTKLQASEYLAVYG